MHLADVLRPEDVLLDVAVSSKAKLLELLAQAAASALPLAAAEVLEALCCREDLGSTGIGSGVAIPHARIERIDAPFVLLVRLALPVAFDAVDDEPIDIVCLILTPPTPPSAHLQLLSSITRQLRAPGALRRIRSATNRAQAYEAFTTPQS